MPPPRAACHTGTARCRAWPTQRTGTDGRPYAIGFRDAPARRVEPALPAPGQRRQRRQGAHPALGQLPILTRNGLAAPGSAVHQQRLGHSEDEPSVQSGGLAKGNVFGLDPQARRDYGYTANDTVLHRGAGADAARATARPERNYMAGCSNGGRHGLVAASRYGDRYDGILAGAPAINLPKAAVQHAWDVQSWQMAHADIRQAFSPADMQLVGHACAGQVRRAGRPGRRHRGRPRGLPAPGRTWPSWPAPAPRPRSA